MARLLRARKISAKELLEVCLDQYALHNDTLNAVVVTDLGRAKHAAMASDKRLKKGTPLGPFDGVPMTAKESFDWKGTPSTWGEPAYKENIATSDAVAITRLTNAGAVLYGQTNLPLLLAAWISALRGARNGHIVLIGVLFLGEKLTRRVAFAALAVAITVGLLVSHELTAIAGRPLGIVWMELAALSWAIGTLMMLSLIPISEPTRPS